VPGAIAPQADGGGFHAVPVHGALGWAAAGIRAGIHGADAGGGLLLDEFARVETETTKAHTCFSLSFGFWCLRNGAAALGEKIGGRGVIGCARFGGVNEGGDKARGLLTVRALLGVRGFVYRTNSIRFFPHAILA
jgi:hypothetical protein